MSAPTARYYAPPGGPAPSPAPTGGAESPPDLGPRYALGAVLGRGGAATVWAARDRATGADVAVKRFASQVGGDFYRELNALTRLRHPAVLRVLNLAWVVAIAYSTAAIRQHVVLDAVAGAALGALFAVVAILCCPWLGRSEGR